ncbi:MAG TPA: copper resistance protein CopZ, partial [Clostridia bacterium]|nr:copper resistance protein CopZ [Clostridia bacterium]
VERVTVNVAEKTVTTVFDSGAVSLKDIKNAIEDQGYDVL